MCAIILPQWKRLVRILSETFANFAHRHIIKGCILPSCTFYRVFCPCNRYNMLKHTPQFILKLLRLQQMFRWYESITQLHKTDIIIVFYDFLYGIMFHKTFFACSRNLETFCAQKTLINMVRKVFITCHQFQYRIICQTQTLNEHKYNTN